MDESKNLLLENEQKIPQMDGAIGEKGTEIPRVSSEDPGKGESGEEEPNNICDEGLKVNVEKPVTVD